MKKIIVFLALLLTGSVFAEGYCQDQTVLGFEDAVFIEGASIPDHNPQMVIDELLVGSVVNLRQADTFATPTTYFELLRIQETHELVLMTVGAEHVCFYFVPSGLVEPNHASGLFGR